MAIYANSNSAIELNPSQVANELLPFFREVFLKAFGESKTEEVYLTREQAATIIGISLPTLDKYTKEGILQKYSLGNSEVQRYKLSEIEVCWLPIRYKD